MSARGDPSAPCCFCNLTEDDELQYGKFYEYDGIVTHYYCLLLSSNMAQKGTDEEGILGFLPEDIQKELRRGKRLVCSYCKKIGATLGCCNVRCKRIFHLPCGLKSDSLHQFFGEFRSYCANHKPKQKIDDHLLKQITSSDSALCYICYDKVDPKNLLKTLWAPCCKKDAWFHRKCIQQLALSAGYFFKCPLCNNNKDFQAAMLEHGIFIPSQDASWELVPNAFEELLYRHNRCDAAKCLCPKGRKYTSSNAKWELALCRICGSQGIHKHCGQLKWANPMWECAECISILNNSANNKDASSDSSSVSSSQKNSDIDLDSDSDISVGTEFPLLYDETKNSSTSYSTSESSMDSVVKLRPGPRCFKLRQLFEAEKLLEMEHSIDGPNNSNNGDKLLSKESQHVKDDYEKNDTSKENISEENLQESAMDDSQKGSSEDKKSQPISQQKEADVITIETDDDDDDEVQVILSNQETNPIDLLKTGKLFTITPQTSTTNMISLNSDDLEDTNMTNESSVMNIKISNVTSLPAEVFESVPDITSKDVELDINSTQMLSSVVSENKWKEADLERPTSLLKRILCEEENNTIKNYKRHKVNNLNNFNKRFSGSYTNRPSVIAHTINEQENGISAIRSTEICEDNHLSCTSGNRISNLSQNYTSLQKTNINSLVENNDVQQSEKSSTTIINNNPVYICIPQKHLYYPTKSLSNTNLTTNKGITTAYNMQSSDAILPQVKNDHQQLITTINNNHQIVLVTQSTTNNVANAIVSTTATKNQTDASDDKKSGTAEIMPVNVSRLDSDSLNRTSCDGDAGSDTDTADETEVPPYSESYGSVADCQSPATTRGIFPQVTNNHSTCHQPRLTPQYVDLQNLKFRVCEAGSVQMILYDTFSVNIPVELSRKRKRPPASLVAPERKSTPASRSRSEASSSFDHSDGASTTEPCVDKVLRSTRNENHLANDKAKCITRGRDEAKENLDPVKSKTLSHKLNNVNLTSEADMVIKSNYACDENDDEIHTRSSDNPSALNRMNCSMNVDNVVDGFVSSDCNQNLRSNVTDVKQPNQASSMEERNDGAKSFCKETTHNFDLNVINANKNAEKILRDDTVSTKENQQDDNRIIVGDRTNNAARLWNNNKHLDSTNIIRLKIQNQSAAQVSNKFTEHGHKQIDVYNSKKSTRCRSFNGRFIKCSRSNCNGSCSNNSSNDSFKISIDLNKIQNLIDDKPELFVSEKGNDEWHECMSHQVNCTQQQMYNIENKNVNQPFKNSELQTSNATSNVEQVPINRDISSSMNTFASYQKSNVALDTSTNVSLINKIRKKFYIRNRHR